VLALGQRYRNHELVEAERQTATLLKPHRSRPSRRLKLLAATADLLQAAD
jgi:hypothetical protein